VKRRRLLWAQRVAKLPRCFICQVGPAQAECTRCRGGVCEGCRFYCLAGHSIVCLKCGTEREHSIRRLIEQLAGTPVARGTVEKRNQLVDALSRYGVHSYRGMWVDSQSRNNVVGLVTPPGSVRDRTLRR